MTFGLRRLNCRTNEMNAEMLDFLFNHNFRWHSRGAGQHSFANFKTIIHKLDFHVLVNRNSETK